VIEVGTTTIVPKLMLGTRRDQYNGIGPLVKKPLGIIWPMNDNITWRASRSRSFRPLSLAELYSRRRGFTTVVFDPRRGEAAVTGLQVRGNPQLRPTVGYARSVSVSFRPSNTWHGSAE
jgi:iron complex outermembrane recepter protein